MRPTIYMALMAACALAPAADAAPAEDFHAQMEAGAGFQASSDSEGFVTRRTSAAASFNPNDSAVRYGAQARHLTYDQANWSRTGRQIVFTGKSGTSASRTFWTAEAGLLQEGGRQSVTGDATFHTALSDTTSIELLANRDVVETARALDEGITVRFIGASVEQLLNPHFTAVALLGQQDFSDDNVRRHARLRLIYQPSLDLGLTLQLRHRRYDSSPNDTRRAYFNPERYRENMALVGWRKRGANWSGSVLGGLGRQRLDGDQDLPTRLLEGTFSVQLAPSQTLNLRATYNRSASFGGPDYSYRAAEVMWNMMF